MADSDDPAMANVRTLWAKKQADGWTQQKLGEAMGYKADTARKSVSQFLKSRDPHISVLRRFASAMGISIATLVRE
jgi:transcriptional regulator with XRE-family HTH domain